MDSGICQTSTASPAEPGGLPFVLGKVWSRFGSASISALKVWSSELLQLLVLCLGLLQDGDVGVGVFPKGEELPASTRSKRSLQLRVFRLGFFQDGNVGVGVFPGVRKARVALATAAARLCAPAQQTAGRSAGDRVRSQSLSSPAANRVPDKRC